MCSNQNFDTSGISLYGTVWAIAASNASLLAKKTVFLPLIGLVDPETLKPGDIIGVNKDSFLILDTLPPE